MREIKFRVWNKITKQYEDNTNYQIDCNDGTVYICVAVPFSSHLSAGIMNDDNCIIEQYTGLNDSNGEEIYEGDILEKEYDNHSSTVGTVKYYAPSFYVDTRDELLSDNFQFNEFYKRKVKIIGNINEE